MIVATVCCSAIRDSISEGSGTTSNIDHNGLVFYRILKRIKFALCDAVARVGIQTLSCATQAAAAGRSQPNLSRLDKLRTLPPGSVSKLLTLGSGRVAWSQDSRWVSKPLSAPLKSPASNSCRDRE